MSEHSSGSFFSQVKQATEAYIQAKVEVFQLDTTEKIVRLSGIISVAMLMIVSFTLFLLALSLMAGFYFAHLLGSYYYGFAVVAGFYLVMFIMFWMVRKKLATFIANKLVHTIFSLASGIKTMHS